LDNKTALLTLSLRCC